MPGVEETDPRPQRITNFTLRSANGMKDGRYYNIAVHSIRHIATWPKLYACYERTQQDSAQVMTSTALLHESLVTPVKMNRF